MVPTANLIVMVVNALLGFAIPVFLVWWAVKKHRANLSTILIGAGVFIVFALVLESIVHQIVLNGPSGAAIQGKTLYYALYGGLMAGLFEETGRFLAMKFLLKKEPTEAKPGVAYGLGHGGVEMAIIFGLSMISTLTMAIMVNLGQTDTLLSTVPAEAKDQMTARPSTRACSKMAAGKSQSHFPPFRTAAQTWMDRPMCRVIAENRSQRPRR